MSIFAPLGNTNVSRGHGVQNDVFTSNVTINCDPRLVVPQTDANIRNGLAKPEIAGKIAVEHDLCDLDVRNLTIHGDLTFDGTIIGCVTIAADGADCCPLTVRNTNVPAAGGQEGNALCVEGSTVMIPLTDPASQVAVGAPALLFLDGTQLTGGTNLTSGDYLRIDARPLATGIGIGVDLDSTNTTTIPMTGKGIQIQKGGSSMNGGGGRLFLATAPIEKGILPDYQDRVTLAEVLGPALSDQPVDGAVTGADQPGGVNDATRTQTALHVNSSNNEGTYAPVAGLLVSGGTTFFGQGTETNHGHIHAAQVEPPKPQIFSENGVVLPQTADLFAVYPDINDPSIFSPPGVAPQRGTDVAGVIFISTTPASATGFLWIPFNTPYPNNCYPSIHLSCDPGFYNTIGSGVAVNSPAMILQNFNDPALNPAIGAGVFNDPAYTANKGFIIPLTGANGRGHVHYQVMGVLGGR